MSSKTPVVTGDRLVRVLRRIGFRVSSVVGSHHVLRHPDGRTTSVPVHAGRTLKRGLLAAILNDAGMTAEICDACYDASGVTRGRGCRHGRRGARPRMPAGARIPRMQ